MSKKVFQNSAYSRTSKSIFVRQLLHTGASIFVTGQSWFTLVLVLQTVGKYSELVCTDRPCRILMKEWTTSKQSFQSYFYWLFWKFWWYYPHNKIGMQLTHNPFGGKRRSDQAFVFQDISFQNSLLLFILPWFVHIEYATSMYWCMSHFSSKYTRRVHIHWFVCISSCW